MDSFKTSLFGYSKKEVDSKFSEMTQIYKNDLEKIKNEYKSKLKALQDKLQQENPEKLKQEIAQLSVENQNMTNRIQAMENSLAESQTAIVTKDNQINLLLEEKAHTEMHTRELIKTLTISEDSNQDKQTKLNSIGKMSKSLSSVLSDTNVDFEENISNLRETLDNLTKLVNNSENVFNKTFMESAALLLHISDLESKNSSESKDGEQMVS